VRAGDGKSAILGGAVFQLNGVLFSRDLMQGYQGQTVTLNRLNGTGTQNITGLNYGPTGGYKASPYGVYLVYGNGEHLAYINSPNPKPAHWPKSRCETNPDEILCGYMDLEAGYMNPIMTLHFPTSITVALQQRFSSIGTMFSYDYTTHESNFGSTRYTCPKTGTEGLHSLAHQLSFGYEGSCRIWDGSMSASEFANSSSTDFMVPEPINLIGTGEVISVNKIPAAEIAAWAGVPVVANYRIELNYDSIAITDIDAYFNQKMANGWSATRTNKISVAAWKATLVTD